jgi:NDP-sugar pyrophosphorylase family protein
MFISLNYLGDQIENHFNSRVNKEINISYINEERPLGTLGALKMTDQYKHDDIIVMNSDLLTNINFEDFYKSFKDADADMAIATTSYNITVPYAVLETENGVVHSFKEKPTYSYFSNAGIYLIKRKYIDKIPKNEFYNATDLITALIDDKKKVISYSILGYWLDIGRYEDYCKAQNDYKHINF